MQNGLNYFPHTSSLARVEAIQQELEQLKKALAHQVGGTKGRTKLKGLWKGIEVTEEDMEEAKKAIFKDAFTFI
ncbi:MAG TPA: hypothetical protein EYP21_10725 [Syntrophaceae bacterium]|nr:hypothetical protein [Syntrophaceae bacterium]